MELNFRFKFASALKQTNKTQETLKTSERPHWYMTRMLPDQMIFTKKGPAVWAQDWVTCRATPPDLRFGDLPGTRGERTTGEWAEISPDRPGGGSRNPGARRGHLASQGPRSASAGEDAPLGGRARPFGSGAGGRILLSAPGRPGVRGTVLRCTAQSICQGPASDK